MKKAKRMEKISITGCNLKYYMGLKKLSFVDISDATGISVRSLKRYITDGTIPSLDNALTICDFLGATLNQIWPSEK